MGLGARCRSTGAFVACAPARRSPPSLSPREWTVARYSPGWGGLAVPQRTRRAPRATLRGRRAPRACIADPRHRILRGVPPGQEEAQTPARERERERRRRQRARQLRRPFRRDHRQVDPGETRERRGGWRLRHRHRRRDTPRPAEQHRSWLIIRGRDIHLRRRMPRRVIRLDPSAWEYVRARARDGMTQTACFAHGMAVPRITQPRRHERPSFPHCMVALSQHTDRTRR